MSAGPGENTLCDLVRVALEQLFGEGKLLIVARSRIASDSIQTRGELAVEGFQVFLAAGNNAEHPE